MHDYLKEEVSLGKRYPSKAGMFYSKMKGGRTFIFEGAYTSISMMGLWVKYIQRKNDKVA